MMSDVIPKEFYLRDPAIVAKELLGKLLVRVVSGVKLSCMIVETEAYYGVEDPASRARRGGDLARVMASDVGRALVFMVHGNWLFNIVAHEEGGVGAILIRACQPIEGIEVMIRSRGVRNVTKLTNGPGKLTKALSIDKRFHGKPVYVRDYGLWIEYFQDLSSTVVSSYRVGVREDLPTKLRFYVGGNPYVSRK
ncbi:MAG: hypothetical protein B6U73_02345 [Desulfurococcales archaeon ex4484_204]|nr:MAG: hypothetical protein B6U73_02345 [Desulfurococcales archaeon ex4484_204]